VEQVLSSVQLQHLKLYHRLNIESEVAHDKNSPCCFNELLDEELEILDQHVCLLPNDFDSPDLNAILYYIAGYVAFKEGICQDMTRVSEDAEAEFLNLVSRGSLSHPTEPLVAFSRSLYIIFQHWNSKKDFQYINCSHRLAKLFLCFGSTFPHDFGEKLCSITKRFANIFFKGLINFENSSLFVTPCTADNNQRKKRKIACQ
jgi:hypothetical protein